MKYLISLVVVLCFAACAKPEWKKTTELWYSVNYHLDNRSVSGALTLKKYSRFWGEKRDTPFEDDETAFLNGHEAIDGKWGNIPGPLADVTLDFREGNGNLISNVLKKEEFLVCRLSDSTDSISRSAGGVVKFVRENEGDGYVQAFIADDLPPHTSRYELPVSKDSVILSPKALEAVLSPVVTIKISSVRYVGLEHRDGEATAMATVQTFDLKKFPLKP
jgi:hypothetical protein